MTYPTLQFYLQLPLFYQNLVSLCLYYLHDSLPVHIIMAILIVLTIQMQFFELLGQHFVLMCDPFALLLFQQSVTRLATLLLVPLDEVLWTTNCLLMVVFGCLWWWKAATCVSLLVSAVLLLLLVLLRVKERDCAMSPHSETTSSCCCRIV